MRIGTPVLRDPNDPAQTYLPGIHLHAAERAAQGMARERDDEFYYLSFRLTDAFISPFKSRRVDFGFPAGGNVTLGEITWYTKYSLKKRNGTKERFWEGCRRVIEGVYSIQKDHCRIMRLPWDEEQAQTSAQEAFARLFQGKWTPPGRGLWKMGTFFVNGLRNSAALQNCAFLSTKDIKENPTKPFMRLMEMCMLGIGVGFDTLGEGQIKLHQPRQNGNHPIIVDDSREGWVESTGLLLESYFKPKKKVVVFDYSQIRDAGSDILGFGGTSAGPKPLIALHERIREAFDFRSGQYISETDIVNVMNFIGKGVQAANVRSSAEIAISHSASQEFLDLKNPFVNPERLGFMKGPDGGPLVGPDGMWVNRPGGGWGFTSNNSIIARVGETDYDDVLTRGLERGEVPGLLWLDVARQNGRVGEPNLRDTKVQGVNPCVTGDTLIATTDGPVRADYLVGRGQVSLVVHGEAHPTTPEGFFCTGTKPVYLLRTKEGHSIKLTADHKVLTLDGFVEAQELSSGDRVCLSRDNEIVKADKEDESFRNGWLVGSLVGDGHFHTISEAAKLQFWGEEKHVLLDYALNGLRALDPSDPYNDRRTGTDVPDRDMVTVSSKGLAYLASEMCDEGKNLDIRTIGVPAMVRAGFLAGIFDADGSVQGDHKKGVSVRLSSSRIDHLHVVQAMLLSLGINSTVYLDRRPAGERLLPDGKGGQALYFCEAQHELVVSKDNLVRFNERVGFVTPSKQEKLTALLDGYTRDPYKDVFTATFDELVYLGAEKVYDCTVPSISRFSANGIIVHNCGEQFLEDNECCTLAESYPTRHANLADYLRTLKFVYLYAKTVTLLPTHWPETNAVMRRNHRIGTGMTGLAMFIEQRGWSELRAWQNQGYAELKKWDAIYSDWLCVRESIRMATIKPSGSVSLLWGVTPGAHWPIVGGDYVRTMRFTIHEKIVGLLEAAGFKIEPNVQNPELGRVAYFPATGPKVKSDKDVSIWQKVSLAAECQRNWSDNAVSVTATFRPEEAAELPDLVRVFEGKLKSLSFMPVVDGEAPFQQMPYSKVSEAEFAELRANITHMDWDAMYDDPDSLEAAGELYCSNDSCELDLSLPSAPGEQVLGAK